MKKISFVLSLSLFVIAFPLELTAANEDFCEKFPQNTKCKNESSEEENNESSSPRRSSERNRDSSIIELLTIDDVEKHLREVGYIDITRNKNGKILTFLMQGRVSTNYIVSNGKGMSLSSYFPKNEKTTLEALNDWNKRLRFSYAYLITTKENNEYVILETTLTVTGGITKDRIKSFFVLHSNYLTNFNRYLSEL